MAAIAALYCHFPFCHLICPFCAFAVHRERRNLHRPYLDALKAEIKLRARSHGGGEPVQALYFGGGTPSTMALEEVAELLDWLRRFFPLTAEAEITFEVNPEDASPEYMAGLGALGINRFSLGLQSFEDETLRALGRNHSSAQSLAAVAALRGLALANFNFDLMCGAPGIAPTGIVAETGRAAGFLPAHISLYWLEIEPGTPFGRDPAVRRWAEDNQEALSEAFLEAAAGLEREGYRHYEVSNFCRSGREGRQNLAVWDGGNYLGFGVGAHSHVDGLRWSNERQIRPYQRRVNTGKFPVVHRERLSQAQKANEFLMLGLRRDTGTTGGKKPPKGWQSEDRPAGMAGRWRSPRAGSWWPTPSRPS